MVDQQRHLRETILFLACTFATVILSVGLVSWLLIGNRNETLKNREVGKTNQLYTRVVACLASVTPIERTPDYVKKCYDRAEESVGIQAERYGDGRK